ncbi:MAG: YraN family protein [Bacteroidales bacterium]|jgi:putative endonuclease|nr:YraN family protein [Bacteroidales bacterium]
MLIVKNGIMDSRAIGKAGEDAALKYLQERNLTLRDKNWRCGHYELDLIMEDDFSIRIVEVKTLSKEDGFSPAENMTNAKISKLIKAARLYYSQNHTEKELFFDAVFVIFDNNQPQIEYIPQAFLPIYSK